jgi:peptide/nickel transport system permease protein
MHLFPEKKKLPLFAGCAILILFAVAGVFAEFLAPYDYRAQVKREPLAPPSTLHFRDANGAFHLRPFIYSQKLIDPLDRRYQEDPSQLFPLAFFVYGSPYKLLGLFRTDVHLFGVEGDSPDGPRVQVLGNDEVGRDRFSRLLVASRFSLIVCPVGTALAVALGVLLGGAAGYGGRSVDAVLMRAADVMLALPTLVLILAARAAFPLELPPARAALLVVTIFVLVGWAETARLTRGLVLSIRAREYVTAAISLGASPGRVIFRHILPNAAGPIAIQALLLLPVFLLTETSLSFLGVGLQEPEPSWGNMLTSATDISVLSKQPFLILTPAICIFLVVLAIHLITNASNGDGAQGRL